MTEPDPNHKAAPLRSWDAILPGDYNLAVVRLATLVKARNNHLLFASVELLPAEIPPPPMPPGGGFWDNFSDVRLCLGRIVLPLDQALDWYQSLWDGQACVPGTAHQIASVPLGAEPDYPGFTLASDAPFSPSWHGRPRIHRLLPMSELDPAVTAIRDGSTVVAAWIRARAWLRDHLHFDLLAHDEWLGSAVLIAPNPLLRGCGPRIVAQGHSGETIELGGQPRRGADLSTATLLIEEKRAGATGWRAQGEPDILGRLYTTAPSQLAAVRHELSCARRGLLDQDEPGWFIRNVSSGGWSQGRSRRVEPPRRQPDRPAFDLSLRPPDGGASPVPLTPLRQLERLRREQADRSGPHAPTDRSVELATVYAFELDRAEAVQRIQRLIAQARNRVLLVDPYLDADDLQEFATAAQQEGVSIQGLINPRPGHARKAGEDDNSVGDMLLAQIEKMRDPAQGFGTIDIRVCTQRKLHDRFLQIDQVVWHCGHSFNQAGRGEVSLMTQVAQPGEIRNILADIFDEALPFETYWVARPVRTRSWRRPAATWLRVLALPLKTLANAVARSRD